jgi:predicted nucleic acid-binding Zn ribbon protein
MPTYLYYCSINDTEFEVQHSIKEELNECIVCKELDMPQHQPKRLIAGGTSFQLSGGGWANSGYSK